MSSRKAEKDISPIFSQSQYDLDITNDVMDAINFIFFFLSGQYYWKCDNEKVAQLVKLCLIKLKQEIMITVWIRCAGADWYFVQKVPFK